MAVRLSAEQRQMAWRLRSKGWKLDEIAAELGCGMSTAHRTVTGQVAGVGRPAVWSPGPRRLGLAEREEISCSLRGGESMTAIAKRLGRCPSTVTREVAANGGIGGYRAWKAHQRAFEQARRPKWRNLDHPELAAFVTSGLIKLWSPQKIARQLRIRYPDDPMMRVSHETIYQTLFVAGRGELRRELHKCLRSGRAARRSRNRLEGPKRGVIPNMVMISERPAEVADRAVPGHWEGDLIIGKNGKSSVGTLVERLTRYVILLWLPNGHTADEVRLAMTAAIGRLPAELWRSVTWDQGREMAGHAQLTADTGVDVYFCDPHSPWQRGSNENTNGLLRDFMPKGVDLSPLNQENLDYFAWLLNTRPRDTLGHMTPSDKLAEVLR